MQLHRLALAAAGAWVVLAVAVDLARAWPPRSPCPCKAVRCGYPDCVTPAEAEAEEDAR